MRHAKYFVHLEFGFESQNIWFLLMDKELTSVGFKK